MAGPGQDRLRADRGIRARTPRTNSTTRWTAWSTQGMQGLVIDLRNNPGGLLDSAVDVAGKFVPPNTVIVSTKGRTPDQTQDFRARAAAGASRLSDRAPDQRLQRERRGDRGGRAEGFAPGDPGRRDDVRQRLGADRAAARQRRGPAPDHGEILYAEQKDDPRGRRRARHRGADHRRGGAPRSCWPRRSAPLTPRGAGRGREGGGPPARARRQLAAQHPHLQGRARPTLNAAPKTTARAEVGRMPTTA